MQVWDALPTMENPVALAIGMFDGVHLGHQRLLQQLHGIQQNKGLTTMVLTFSNHPLSVVSPDNAPPFLTTLAEKTRLIGLYHPDHIVVLPFTRELAELEPEAFCNWLMDSLFIRHIQVGYNFSFGKDARGNADFLRKKGKERDFSVSVLSAVMKDGAPVSSTRIRTLLLVGETMAAAALMGRAYILSGKSIEGRKLGRMMQLPTVNLEASTEKVIPKRGVYVSMLEHQGTWIPSVTNIGYNPSVLQESVMHIETHCLSNVEVGYNKDIRIAILDRLRDEMQFSCLEELKARIEQDVADARSIHELKNNVYKQWL